jgi:hypothetical protein
MIDIVKRELTHAWSEVDRHFDQALAAEADLKKTLVSLTITWARMHTQSTLITHRVAT